MFWRRKTYPRFENPDALQIRAARRELRRIERDLAGLDSRAQVDEVRRLTALHAHWREHLAALGVKHPAPVIAW